MTTEEKYRKLLEWILEQCEAYFDGEDVQFDTIAKKIEEAL